MATSRPRRSWTLRTRPSHSPPEVSSAPTTPTDNISHSQNETDATLNDEILLRSMRKLISEADQLFSKGATITNSRVLAIRRKVEEAMPRLYELSEDCSASHSRQHASRVMQFAESLLLRFPDAANSGVLRPQSKTQNNAPPRTGHSPSSETVHSPDASAGDVSPMHISPPQAQLPQAAIPPKPLPQPVAPGNSVPVSAPPMRMSQGLIVPQSQAVQSHIIPQSFPQHTALQSHSIPQALMPPAHPPQAAGAASALSAPVAHYPQVRMPNTQGVLRPPVASFYPETTYAPFHLREAVKQTTRHQKMALFAVHDLLRKSSLRQGTQPWYEPPIGLSPEEFKRAQGQRNDVRLQRPNYTVPSQRYLQPTHPPPSPAGPPYSFGGNRSVAVGRSRSASTE